MAKAMTSLQLRNLQSKDLLFVRQMLYDAVYWQKTDTRPSLASGLDILADSSAIAGLGSRHGDKVVIACWNGDLAGAAWFRFYSEKNAIRGYAEDTVPVLVIAVHKRFRRRGIAKEMIQWLARAASEQNIAQMSLMVSKANPAQQLYLGSGFYDYKDCGDSKIMYLDVLS